MSPYTLHDRNYNLLPFATGEPNIIPEGKQNSDYNLVPFAAGEPNIIPEVKQNNNYNLVSLLLLIIVSNLTMTGDKVNKSECCRENFLFSNVEAWELYSPQCRARWMVIAHQVWRWAWVITFLVLLTLHGLNFM